MIMRFSIEELKAVLATSVAGGVLGGGIWAGLVAVARSSASAELAAASEQDCLLGTGDPI